MSRGSSGVEKGGGGTGRVGRQWGSAKTGAARWQEGYAVRSTEEIGSGGSRGWSTVASATSIAVEALEPKVSKNLQKSSW